MINSTVAAAQEPPPAKVVVAEIGQQEVAENQSFIGLLYYDRISNVSSEVSGLVKRIEVKEGDRIEKGTHLVRLNTDLLDMEIAMSRTRIEQIGLRIQQAEKNYKRLDALFAEQGVSEKDFDDTLFTHQDYIKDKQIAEKELEQLLLQKKKSVINAPFAGVILEKNVDSGDWVQQGKQLVRIGSIQDLFVRVPVAETLLQFISIDATVPVVINAFNKEVEGTIEDLDPTADAKTKNVFLKVRIPAIAKVAENMSATVFVPTSSKRKLSIIPRDALVKFQGQDFVYTVKDGKAAILPVNIVTYLGNTVGADNPYFVPGMAVVVEGNERLQPDQPVFVAGEQ
jgi:RND family efflux transporter MFP subunit